MVSALKKIKILDAIILCFNGECPRFDENLKGLLKIFSDVFGDKFLANVGILITRWR